MKKEYYELPYYDACTILYVSIISVTAQSRTSLYLACVLLYMYDVGRLLIAIDANTTGCEFSGGFHRLLPCYI